MLSIWTNFHPEIDGMHIAAFEQKTKKIEILPITHFKEELHTIIIF